MRIRPLSALALFTTLGFAACGPAPKPVPPPPPPVVKGETPIPVETPSRWALRSSDITGRVDLGAGLGVLYFGANGERWLKESEQKPPTHATTFATEQIVAAKKTAEGFLFLTISGGVYSAPTPLGAFGPRRPPPPKLGSIDVGKEAFVAIRAGKELVRSTDGGLTWKPVALPKIPGVLTRVVMTPGGVGAALFAPQRLLFTSDDGVTWNEAQAPQGAGPLLSASDTGVFLRNNDGWFELKRDVAKFEKSGSPPGESLELDFPGNRNTAYADAVLAGTGALSGNRYYELIGDEATDTSVGNSISLYVEELGKHAAQKKLTTLACSHAKLAVSGKIMEIACYPSWEGGGDEGQGPPQGGFTLQRSEDGGATWKPDGSLVSSGRPDERMWLGPDGTIAFKGACLPGVEACSGHGVVRPAGASAFEDIKVEGVPSFYALSFGKAGSVYGVGTSDTDDGRKAFVFTSHDSGKTFTRQPFPGAEQAEVDPTLAFVKRRGALVTDAAGNLVGAAIAYEGSWFYASTADDGKTFAAAPIPPVNALSFAGLRGFGMGPNAKGYESFDGGKSWTQVSGLEDETNTVVCDTHGCLIGVRAARVGWDLTKGGGDWTKAPKEAPAPKKLAYRTPLACKVEGPATNFAGVADGNALLADSGDGVRNAYALPDVKLRGLKALVVKPGGKQGFEVKDVVVLPALPAPKEKDPEKLKAAEKALSDEWRFSYAIVPGGIVGMRWKGPAPKTTMMPKKPAGVTPPPPPPEPKDAKKDPKKDAKPKQEETTSVELGWWIAKTNTVAHAKIDKLPVRVSVDGLSIANDGGLTVISMLSYNPHQVHFVSKAGKVESSALPAKTPGYSLLRNAQKLGASRFIYMIGSSGLLEQWTSEKDSWVRDAVALWPGWTPGLGSPRYLRQAGSSPSFVLFAPRSESLEAAALNITLQAGAPAKISAVPLQSEIDDKNVCGKDSGTRPRVVLPFVNGSRHPVSVSNDDGKSFEVGTTDEIVRLDGDKGCIAGWTTDRMYADGGTYDVYLPADDLAHAVLVRRKGAELSFRALSCTMNAGPLPPSLAERDGFTE